MNWQEFKINLDTLGDVHYIDTGYEHEDGKTYTYSETTIYNRFHELKSKQRSRGEEVKISQPVKNWKYYLSSIFKVKLDYEDVSCSKEEFNVFYKGY